MTDEEKNSMELDIEAKYVGKTEKEFLSNITYAECLYILDTKNKYCDDIKNLSLLKIVDIVNEQSSMDYYNLYKELVDKIKAKIEEIKNECKYCDFTDEFCQELLQNNNCTQGNTLKVLQSLLEKE